MGVAVLRLALICLLVLVALVAVGGALADRSPVLAVVASGGSPHDSLNQAIRRQLSIDQLVLADARRAQTRDSALVLRAQAELAHSADPFPIEDRLTTLRQRVAADAARTSRIARAIKGLQLSLRPVRPPADVMSGTSSAVGAYAVTIAERYLNVRYVWGGNNPDEGFDCSGFMRYVYAQVGIQLPRYAASQYTATMHIDPSQLEPGDLVFFEPRADGPGHVGMYVGNDFFIEAPHTGDVVKFARLSTEASLIGFVGATRPAV